jgi:NAD(P)-dependent dehydrogenase (short-subunit alcohol dehydrogenase family)
VSDSNSLLQDIKMTTQQQIVVVTGAASGIGAACARELAQQGWKVVLADVNENAARVLADEIGGYAIGLDVTDDRRVEAVAAEVERNIGPVFGLVNSAGIIQKPLRPHELDMATWDQIQKVNFRGSYIVSLAFARAMLERRGGSIVNISSITGSRSTPLHAYGPSKAAVVSMTQCLAAEWGPQQIRVNSIAPGYTLTPALQGAIDRGERKLSSLQDNAALQRPVMPSQIADAAAFLLSSRAAAITGVDLPVDCGWLAATGWSTYGGLRSTTNAGGASC